MALGLLYGMGTQSLASKVGCTVDEARDLRRAHQRAYPQFWRWATNSVALARSPASSTRQWVGPCGSHRMSGSAPC